MCLFNFGKNVKKNLKNFDENFSVSGPLDITRSTDLIDLFIKTDLKTVSAYFRIH